MSTSGFAPVTYPQLELEKLPGSAAAQARGYAAGYSEGLRRATLENLEAEAVREQRARESIAATHARTAKALASLNIAVDELNRRAAPSVAEADSVLIEAALELAEAIIGREVAEGHNPAADALRRALADVPAEQRVTVRLNPEDAATVSGSVPDTVRIVADSAIASGDAMTELPHGWFDARIGAALDRARILLTGERS
jgi:flagellar assembly protein FliH